MSTTTPRLPPCVTAVWLTTVFGRSFGWLLQKPMALFLKGLVDTETFPLINVSI